MTVLLTLLALSAPVSDNDPPPQEADAPVAPEQVRVILECTTTSAKAVTPETLRPERDTAAPEE